MRSGRNTGLLGFQDIQCVRLVLEPKISAFITAKIDKILALKPDCVFGFSDLQADIAASLIRSGVHVTIFNARSIAESFSMMGQVAAIGHNQKKDRRWLPKSAH